MVTLFQDIMHNRIEVYVKFRSYSLKNLYLSHKRCHINIHNKLLDERMMKGLKSSLVIMENNS